MMTQQVIDDAIAAASTAFVGHLEGAGNNGGMCFAGLLLQKLKNVS